MTCFKLHDFSFWAYRKIYIRDCTQLIEIVLFKCQFCSCRKFLLSLFSSSIITVPSQPRNVTIHEVTPSSIRISWLEPDKPNGPNLIYRIYYTFLNQTLLAMPKNDPENVAKSESGIHYYTLKRLSKYRHKLTLTFFSLMAFSFLEAICKCLQSRFVIFRHPWLSFPA